MDLRDTQLVIRELITESDQLSRIAHAEEDDEYAARFAAVRTQLARLERLVGADRAPLRRTRVAGEIDLVFQRLRALEAVASEHERARVSSLLERASELRGRARVEPRRARPVVIAAAAAAALAATTGLLVAFLLGRRLRSFA